MRGSARVIVGSVALAGCFVYGCQERVQVGNKGQADVVQVGNPVVRLEESAPIKQQQGPVGFSEEQAAEARRVYAEVVSALNDLDLANGIERVTGSNGKESRRYVEPMFGFTRTGIQITHQGSTRKPIPHDHVGVFGLGAKGKPLTTENLRVYGQIPVKTERPVQLAKVELSKMVAEGRVHHESSISDSDLKIWIKPLKLTKRECLSCHEGMKIGDVVGALAFYARDRKPR